MLLDSLQVDFYRQQVHSPLSHYSRISEIDKNTSALYMGKIICPYNMFIPTELIITILHENNIIVCYIIIDVFFMAIIMYLAVDL